MHDSSLLSGFGQEDPSKPHNDNLRAHPSAISMALAYDLWRYDSDQRFKSFARQISCLSRQGGVMLERITFDMSSQLNLTEKARNETIKEIMVKANP